MQDMLDDYDNPEKILNLIQIIIYYYFAKKGTSAGEEDCGMYGPLLMINAFI